MHCASLTLALLGTLALHACKPADSAVATVNTESVTAAKPDSKSKPKSTPEPRRLAAMVDDLAIYEDELAPVVQTGVDRAIALDRAINRVITARAAKQFHEQEAQAAVENASREILSQLYLQKATQKLSDSITDKEIKDWYDRRITADDYREYQAGYVLMGNAEEANRIATDAARSDKKALAQFKPITDQPDQWLKARDFPYGLGQMVARMKAGDISKPVALRNGWFVLMLKQTRENPPPALDTVKTEIRNILVSEALVKDINRIRQSARIELK